MVAVALDDAAACAAAAAHGQAVGVLLDLDAERAQHGGGGGDAIGLLDAQLGGVGDARLALGVGGDGGEQRQLVDGAHGELAVDADGAQARRPALHDRSATGSPPTSRSSATSMRAPMARERVDDAGARRVDADAAHDDAAARHHGGGAEEEGRRRQIAGDQQIARGEAAVPAARIDGDAEPVDGERRAHVREHALGVIARALRLDDDRWRRRRRARRARSRI